MVEQPAETTWEKPRTRRQLIGRDNRCHQELMLALHRLRIGQGRSLAHGL
jgi:hypothetical protein